MARSQFVWLLVYDDTTTQYIKAQSIHQIMDCDKINSYSITNIIRMELVSWGDDEYPDAIKIPFED